VPSACSFCRIRDGDVFAHVVLDEPAMLAFLDHRPVFPGHVLLLPRDHVETLMDLPSALDAPLLDASKRIAQAVIDATGAEGTFVASNNRVSQSVPHLHVHVVPRTKGDGLRGFFWPRTKYASEDEAASMAAGIRAALDELAAGWPHTTLR